MGAMGGSLLLLPLLGARVLAAPTFLGSVERLLTPTSAARNEGPSTAAAAAAAEGYEVRHRRRRELRHWIRGDMHLVSTDTIEQATVATLELARFGDDVIAPMVEEVLADALKVDSYPWQAKTPAAPASRCELWYQPASGSELKRAKDDCDLAPKDMAKGSQVEFRNRRKGLGCMACAARRRKSRNRVCLETKATLDALKDASEKAAAATQAPGSAAFDEVVSHNDSLKAPQVPFCTSDLLRYTLVQDRDSYAEFVMKTRKAIDPAAPPPPPSSPALPCLPGCESMSGSWEDKCFTKDDVEEMARKKTNYRPNPKEFMCSGCPECAHITKPPPPPPPLTPSTPMPPPEPPACPAPSRSPPPPPPPPPFPRKLLSQENHWAKGNGFFGIKDVVGMAVSLDQLKAHLSNETISLLEVFVEETEEDLNEDGKPDGVALKPDYRPDENGTSSNLGQCEDILARGIYSSLFFRVEIQYHVPEYLNTMSGEGSQDSSLLHDEGARKSERIEACKRNLKRHNDFYGDRGGRFSHVEGEEEDAAEEGEEAKPKGWLATAWEKNMAKAKAAVKEKLKYNSHRQYWVKAGALYDRKTQGNDTAADDDDEPVKRGPPPGIAFVDSLIKRRPKCSDIGDATAKESGPSLEKSIIDRVREEAPEEEHDAGFPNDSTDDAC